MDLNEVELNDGTPNRFTAQTETYETHFQDDSEEEKIAYHFL